MMYAIPIFSSTYFTFQGLTPIFLAEEENDQASSRNYLSKLGQSLKH